MTNNSIPFRSLLLTSVVSILIFPTLSINSKTTSAQTAQINYWQRLKEIFRRKRRKPISRPSNAICLITPQFPQPFTGNPPLIYNTKPFILWKGDIKKIVIENFSNKEYLKTQIVTGTQSLNYTGQALQPGNTYKLSIFLTELKDSHATQFVPFRIIQTPQRESISAELNRLEKMHKNDGKEAIAFSKAKYFAQQGLLTDALQQAYTVPNPSPELSQFIKDLPNHFCENH